MNDDVFLETSNLNPADRKLFARWLARYEAENAVNRVFGSDPDIFAHCEGCEDPAKLAAAAVPDRTPPAPGQIRMLKASLTSDPEIITPVLILSQWEGSRWLIAPFSRFDVPATPGEMSTGEDFSAYKVLEVWNAAVVPEFLLCSGTVFLRTAPETLRKEACQLYFHLLADDELPQEVAAKVGPPIRSGIDPRIQYLLCEEEHLRGVHAEAARLNDLFARLPAGDEDEPPLTLAAGEAGKTALFYAVENTGSAVRCLVRDDKLEIRVFTADRMDYSHELDNWMVLRADGKVLGTVADAACRIAGISGPADAVRFLAAPEGTVHTLAPVEGE